MPLSVNEMRGARKMRAIHLKDERRTHLNAFIQNALTDPNQTAAILTLNKEEAKYVHETYLPLGYLVILQEQTFGAFVVTVRFPDGEA